VANDSEVDDPDLPSRIDHDVGGFDVPVDESGLLETRAGPEEDICHGEHLSQGPHGLAVQS